MSRDIYSNPHKAMYTLSRSRRIYVIYIYTSGQFIPWHVIHKKPFIHASMHRSFLVHMYIYINFRTVFSLLWRHYSHCLLVHRPEEAHRFMNIYIRISKRGLYMRAYKLYIYVYI